MKIGTVALVIAEKGKKPVLLECLSDDQEITYLETALEKGEVHPLDLIHALRENRNLEAEEFGDYVEELLTQPFVKPEIQKHGVQWLKSKVRIEEFQKTESEAVQVISQYAYKLYLENPKRVDFFLAGPNARVRIRVFTIPAAGSEWLNSEGDSTGMVA